MVVSERQPSALRIGDIVTLPLYRELARGSRAFWKIHRVVVYAELDGIHAYLVVQFLKDGLVFNFDVRVDVRRSFECHGSVLGREASAVKSEFLPFLLALHVDWTRLDPVQEAFPDFGVRHGQRSSAIVTKAAIVLVDIEDDLKVHQPLDVWRLLIVSGMEFIGMNDFGEFFCDIVFGNDVRQASNVYVHRKRRVLVPRCKGDGGERTGRTVGLPVQPYINGALLSKHTLTMTS